MAEAARTERGRLVAALVGPVVCSVSLVVATGFLQPADGPNLGEAITIGSGLLAFAVAGGLILWHRPRHAVGWLLATVGAVPMLGVFAEEAAVRSAGIPRLALGLASAFTWMSVFAGVVVLLVVYPSGRPLTPRWRWVVWLALLGAVAGAVMDAGRYDSAVGGVVPGWVLSAADILVFSLLVALVAAIASVVVRFRRAGPRERAQLRLFLSAVAVAALTLPFTGDDETLSNVLFGLALMGFPAAIATAVVRHQLYDIDRAIKRTFVYALATGLLVALYAGIVLAVQQIVGSGDRPDVLVAATTLLAAAMFRPLVTRIQRVLDTRFDRARYDAQQAVASFGTRLRDQVDLVALRDDLGDTVAATLAPAHASLWLRRSSS